MKAHVICCNDSVEFVIVGNELAARDKLYELRKEDFRQKKSLCEYGDMASYSRVYFWHTNIVDAEVWNCE